MESKTIDIINQSADKFAESDTLAIDAINLLKNILKGATFDYFESVRRAWQGRYIKARATTEAGAVMAWKRIVDTAGIKKPKAENAKAQKVSAERQAKAESLAKMTAEQIAQAKALLAKKAVEGDTKATAEIKALNKEVERRAKDANKGQAEIIKSKQKALIERIKAEHNLEMLTRLESLMDSIAKGNDKPQAEVKTAKVRKVA